MKHKKILLSILGVIAALVVAPFALAQQQGLQISPLTYTFELEPGESVDAKVLVTNLSDTDLEYVMETENFSDVSEVGAPSFSAPIQQSGLTTLAEWVTFEEGKEKGVLKPKEEIEVNYTVSVPLGAEPGGHYAAVFAKGIKKNADGQTELGVASRVGTLMLVTVPGAMIKTGQIVETENVRFAWQGPLNFMMRFKNTGTVHYTSEAKVELKPLIRKAQYVDMGEHVVLPNAIRKFEGTLKNNEGEDVKYPFGFFQVKYEIPDGDDNIQTVTSLLIAIPLMIVLPALGALIVLFLLYNQFKSNFKIVAKK